MALLLLIVIGASAGWLASIIARTEAPGEILRQTGIGVATSLIIGLLANDNSLLGGLTPLALLLAILGSAAALVAYHLVVRDRLST